MSSESRPRTLAGSTPARRHREFTRPDLVTPEPLTTRERRRLPGALLDERFSQEMSYLQQRLVPTSAQNEFMDLVTRTVERVGHALPGAQQLPYAYGYTGTGKTTCAKEVARLIYRSLCTPEEIAQPYPGTIEDSTGQSTYLPVLWINTPSEAGVNAISVNILKAMGYPARYRTGTDLTPQVEDRIAQHGVRLVLFDDTGNLALQRKNARVLFNHIKYLNQCLGDLRVTLAFTEKQTPDSTLVKLTDNDQTGIRSIKVDFRPAMIDPDAASITDADRRWAGYLRDWETALAPVLCDAVPGDLSNYGRLLWGYGGGAMVQIANFLRGLAEEAIRTQTFRITPELIRQARPSPLSLEQLRRDEALG